MVASPEGAFDLNDFNALADIVDLGGHSGCKSGCS